MFQEMNQQLTEMQMEKNRVEQTLVQSESTSSSELVAANAKVEAAEGDKKVRKAGRKKKRKKEEKKKKRLNE